MKRQGNSHFNKIKCWGSLNIIKYLLFDTVILFKLNNMYNDILYKWFNDVNIQYLYLFFLIILIHYNSDYLFTHIN